MIEPQDFVRVLMDFLVVMEMVTRVHEGIVGFDRDSTFCCFNILLSIIKFYSYDQSTDKGNGFSFDITTNLWTCEM